MVSIGDSVLPGSSLLELAPLRGATQVDSRWSTMGGDTGSFVQVLQAPPQPRKNMDQRHQNYGRFNNGYGTNRSVRG